MAASVTITPVLQIGSVDLGFTVSNAPNSTITKLTTITNENSANTKMVETSNHPIVDSSGQPVSKVVLSSTLAPAGKLVFVTLIITYADKTVVTSPPIAVTAIDIPKSPSGLAPPATPTQPGSNVFKEDDGGISMTIGNIYSYMSSTDGYSPITSAIVYLSKVGGTNAADFMRETINIDNGYNTFYTVKTGLTNGAVYEVAFRVVNALGQSSLSDTYYLTPKDVPAKLDAPDVYTLLRNQGRTGVTLNDPRGDMVVYFNKPSDANSVAPVTNYIITEKYDVSGSSITNKYTIKMDASNNPVMSDPVTTAVLAGVPASPASQFFTVINTNATDNTSGDATFINTRPYKLTILGTAARLGKAYTYSVTAVNTNGSSPESELSSKAIRPFLIPSAQTSANCLLLHTDVSGSTVNNGLSYRTHTGKMTMRISALSSINSGNEYIDSSNNPIYKLEVTDISLNSMVYSDEVKFIRSGTPGNYVYNLDFDNVIRSSDSKNLNDVLVKGTKYRFALFRLSLNPNETTTNIILSSPALNIDRTPFSSPGKIRLCEAYSYNDDLTPVKRGNSAAIRVLFGRLLPEDMNGLTTAVTGTASSGAKTAIRYQAFQNSQPVFLDASGNRVAEGTTNAIPVEKSHYPEVSDPYEFVVPVATLGTSTSNYIRVQIWNEELGIYINSVESSPAFVEQALSFVKKPSNVAVTKTAHNSISVTYTNQDIDRMSGNSSGNITNRVVLVDDYTSSQVGEQLLTHSTSPTPIPSANFTGLTVGRLYRVYVVAETYYNRREYNSIDVSGNPTDTTKRFDSVIIRDPTISIESTLFVMTGIPTVPQNLEFFASAGAVTAYYDEPLNTYGVSNLYYHIYAYRSVVTLPTASADQVSIANSQGTTFMTINNAVNNTGSLPSAFANNTKYNMYMRVKGTIGDLSLNNMEIVQSYTGGKVKNLGVSNYLSLINPTDKIYIPSEDIYGLLSAEFPVVPDTGVPTPSSVSVTAQSGKLIVSLIKETINVTDLVISINYNDGTPAVPSFDTRLARRYEADGKTLRNNGLFSLENRLTTASGWVPASFAPYEFTIRPVTSTTNGVTTTVDYYDITFAGLTNGVNYDFRVRYCKYALECDTFSTESVVTGSSETSPDPIVPGAFSVGDQKIIINWTKPSNPGKAGAVLSYTIRYVELDTQGAPINTTTEDLIMNKNVPADVSRTSFTYEKNNLKNSVDYVVSVAAYYIKEDGSPVYGDYTIINSVLTLVDTVYKYVGVNGGKIKPRPAPVGAVITTTAGNNSITYTIVRPSQAELNNYKITNAKLYIQNGAVSNTKTLLRTITDTEYENTSAAVTDTLNSFNLTGVNSLFTHSKPLNAFNYTLILEYTANYTDAQNIPFTSTSVTPFGPVAIESVTASGNTVTAVVNLNGSGAITNIIGLAKASGSNNILVVTPSIATAQSAPYGSQDSNVASGQKRTITLTYSGISSVTGISDTLTVVATGTSSDTLANTNTFFA